MCVVCQGCLAIACSSDVYIVLVCPQEPVITRTKEEALAMIEVMLLCTVYTSQCMGAECSRQACHAGTTVCISHGRVPS